MEELNEAPETGEIEVEETPIEGEEQVVEEEIKEEPTLTIEELAKEQKELKRQLDKANKRTQYLQRKLSRPVKQTETQPQGSKPREEDFDTNSEYVEAVTDWKVAETNMKMYAEQLKQQEAERKEYFWETIETGSAKYEDFNSLVYKEPKDGGPVINETMTEVLMEMDNPADVVYHLSKNVKESIRIASLSPLAAAKELGRLEIEIGLNNNKVPQKIKTTTVTPPSPLTGKTTPEIDLADLPMDDFYKSRNRRDGLAT